MSRLDSLMRRHFPGVSWIAEAMPNYRGISCVSLGDRSLYVKSSDIMNVPMHISPGMESVVDVLNLAVCQGLYPPGTVFEALHDETGRPYVCQIIPGLMDARSSGEAISGIEDTDRNREKDRFMTEWLVNRGIPIGESFLDKVFMQRGRIISFLARQGYEPDTDVGAAFNYAVDLSGKVYYFDMHMIDRVFGPFI